MYTLCSVATREPSHEVLCHYSVKTTTLNDGTLMVYALHQLTMIDLEEVEAQVGVSLQFEYNPQTKRISDIAFSFEDNDMPSDEKIAIRDFLVCNAIDEIESVYEAEGEYRYLNDLDTTLFEAPVTSGLVLSDLSAERLYSA